MGGMRGDPHDGAGLGERVVPMLETTPIPIAAPRLAIAMDHEGVTADGR